MYKTQCLCVKILLKQYFTYSLIGISLAFYPCLKSARVLLLTSPPPHKNEKTCLNPVPSSRNNPLLCSLTSVALRDLQLSAVFAFLPYPSCDFSKVRSKSPPFYWKASQKPHLMASWVTQFGGFFLILLWDFAAELENCPSCFLWECNTLVLFLPCNYSACCYLPLLLPSSKYLNHIKLRGLTVCLSCSLM